MTCIDLKVRANITPADNAIKLSLFIYYFFVCLSSKENGVSSAAEKVRKMS